MAGGTGALLAVNLSRPCDESHKQHCRQAATPYARVRQRPNSFYSWYVYAVWAVKSRPTPWRINAVQNQTIAIGSPYKNYSGTLDLIYPQFSIIPSCLNKWLQCKYRCSCSNSPTIPKHATSIPLLFIWMVLGRVIISTGNRPTCRYSHEVWKPYGNILCTNWCKCVRNVRHNRLKCL